MWVLYHYIVQVVVGVFKPATLRNYAVLPDHLTSGRCYKHYTHSPFRENTHTQTHTHTHAQADTNTYTNAHNTCYIIHTHTHTHIRHTKYSFNHTQTHTQKLFPTFTLSIYLSLYFTLLIHTYNIYVLGICRHLAFPEMPGQLWKLHAFPEKPRQLQNFFFLAKGKRKKEERKNALSISQYLSVCFILIHINSNVNTHIIAP